MAFKTRLQSRKFIALLFGTAITIVLVIALWREPSYLVAIGCTYLTVCVAGYMGANAFQRTRPEEVEKPEDKQISPTIDSE